MAFFEELGVQPIINASGSVTRLGGAPMPRAVIEAYCAAADGSASLEQVQAAACRKIAAATGAEAGLVTAGAAAALTLGTAAILAGYDLRRMELLPHADGSFPNEFVVAREQRNGYDHAVRAAGATLVEVGFHEIVANAGVRRAEVWEYEATFGPRTAGLFYVYAPDARPELKALVAAAHARGVPVLVDAAGELPPRSNLKGIIASGADLVAFSGGKAIRGPQSTGILCGRRNLIGSAALQMLDMDDHFDLWEPPPELIDKSKLPGMPRHGIGRGFKVAKEQIAALLKALELFTAGDYECERSTQCRHLTQIAAALEGCASQALLVDRGEDGPPPVLEIAVNEAGLGRSALDVCRRLRRGSPPCYVGHAKLSGGKLVINPLHLDDARTAVLAARLREELTCSAVL
ncbi:MAG TPA: aminotransferase class V-fold PLP-dependent enzyme [Pirellulales bacterium]|nr:aminotransferase class V-fold PLP-dependent enzyme [Pirellulales bacterium]